MTAPFVRSDGGLVLGLEQHDRRAVDVVVAALLDDAGTTTARLDYVTHPDDDAAEHRFRELIGTDLDDLRRLDREGFSAVVAGAVVGTEEIAAFMRVVGEARLVLAGQIGITTDGWESDESDDPRVALLGLLGWLQDAAVAALSSPV